MLTFREVVRYFTDQRPTDPRIVGGALLRKRGRGASRYHQFFIDARDRPVIDSRGVMYGRIIRTDEVDDELAAAFGEHHNDLVIFR